MTEEGASVAAVAEIPAEAPLPDGAKASAEGVAKAEEAEEVGEAREAEVAGAAEEAAAEAGPPDAPSPDVVGWGNPTAPEALAASVPTLTGWLRGLALLGLVGASLGLAVGLLAFAPDLASYLGQNLLAPGQRRALLACLAGGAVVAVALGAAVAAWGTGRVTSSGPFGPVPAPTPAATGTAAALRARRIEQVGRRLSPLMVLGLFPLLFDWRAWRDRDVDFLTLVAVMALLASRLVRLSLDTSPLFTRRAGTPRMGGTLFPRLDSLLPFHGPDRRAHRAALAIVGLGTVVYAAFFSFFTIRYHHNLHSTSFDLALEENILWNLIHGFKFFRSSPFSGSSGSHFGNHATFFSYLIAPIYALYQHAETLLVIQAVMMGAAAIPLFFFGRRHLGAWVGCAVALTYLLYPPLHGAALYDFHYLPLGPVFLWSALYCLEARRDRFAVVFIVLTMSVREDVAVGLAIVGAYLVITGERPRAGVVVGAIGAFTFVALKLVIMPRFAGHDSFVYMYSGLLPAGESTFGGVLKTVVTNPGFTFASLVETSKLVYLLQLFVPLALLPFVRPLGLLFTATGVLFTLLSTGYAPLIQTSFQYTTHWTSYLFIGLVATLAWLRRDASGAPLISTPRATAAVVALGCAILPSTYQYGALLQQHTVRGGFGVYDFDTTPEELAQRVQLKELLRQVPPRASMAGSENLVPQFSNRAEAYTLRTGNFGADYLLFTLPIRSDERSYVFDPVKNGEYGLVAMSGPFALAKRGHPTTLNPTVLPRM